MADLLQWHRREAKPEWWQYYARVNEYDLDDFLTDGETLGGITLVGEVGRVRRSTIWRYGFTPDQEHRFSVGDVVHDASGRKVGEIVAIDNADCTVDVQRGNSSQVQHPTVLMPGDPIKTEVLKKSLAHVARTLLAHGIDGDGPALAARRLVGARSPRVLGLVPGEPLVLPGESGTDAAVRVASRLDESVLPIQGPPGTGKTFTAARIILDRVRAGKRVGITAFTHSAIANLLRETLKLADADGVDLRVLQKVSREEQRVDHPAVTAETEPKKLADACTADVDVVTGTVWLFARNDMLDVVDTLIVDEAGQMSLANVVAAAPCAANVVLVGDPQQLSQPSKGTHPDGAGVSALEHLLRGASTVPPDRGILLEETRRLHPKISAFISDQLYDGRLRSYEHCEHQQVCEGELVHGSGLRFLPVEHAGNKTSSEEEAEVIRRVFESLLSQAWINQSGEQDDLTLRDVLVVTPYNAQVQLLSRVLPESARIGTVDKFQGQQAAVVIVSMVASTADDVPRGMEFLYSRNRLNVAVSRAKALALVVGSPRLLDVRCRSVEQMRLANMLCRFVELADRVEIPAP